MDPEGIAVSCKSNLFHFIDGIPDKLPFIAGMKLAGRSIRKPS